MEVRGTFLFLPSPSWGLTGLEAAGQDDALCFVQLNRGIQQLSIELCSSLVIIIKSEYAEQKNGAMCDIVGWWFVRFVRFDKFVSFQKL